MFILQTMFTGLEIIYANVSIISEKTKITLRTRLKRNSLLDMFLEVMKYMCQCDALCLLPAQ